MPRFLDRLLQLGPSDDPRSVAVGTRKGADALDIVSVPGARVRLRRDGRDAEVQLALLWCTRNGVPVELASGSPAIHLDGAPVALADLMARLRP